MASITFLGPVGATFSHDAYDILANIYGAPPAITEGPEANCMPASTNGEILPLLIAHHGYGTIAMETRAEGRVAEPLESFIELLESYHTTFDCPLRILAAIKLKIHFCLLVRRGVSMDAVHTIAAHPKALGACRDHIAVSGKRMQTVSSNGEAARLVAQDPAYAHHATLGPLSASTKYGLQVVDGAYEDHEAITTFFLLGPSTDEVFVGQENRALIVFKVADKPGALVRALTPFSDRDLNLMQIHSVHASDYTYIFAVEVEAEKHQLGSLHAAMNEFAREVDEYLSFGPFEVLSR